MFMAENAITLFLGMQHVLPVVLIFLLCLIILLLFLIINIYVFWVLFVNCQKKLC